MGTPIRSKASRWMLVGSASGQPRHGVDQGVLGCDGDLVGLDDGQVRVEK